MEPKKSQFNRNLFIVLAIFFLLMIAGMSYVEWRANAGQTPPAILLANAILLAIPALLLFGPVYVLVAARHELAGAAQVSTGLARAIYWAPRLAAILIAFFIGLFSLDVFEMEASPLELLGGFLMHNIPSFILIVLLVIAWKRPAVGFWTYLAAAVVLAIFFLWPVLTNPGARDMRISPGLLLFAVPLLLIAALFYANWKWLKPRSQGL